MSKNNFVDLAIEDNLVTNSQLSGAAEAAPKPALGGSDGDTPEMAPEVPSDENTGASGVEVYPDLPADFDLSEDNLQKLEHAFA